MCIRYAEKALAKRLQDNIRCTQSDNINTKVNETPKLFTSNTTDAKEEYESNSTTAKIERGQEDECGNFQIDDPIACNLADHIKSHDDNSNENNDDRHNREETDN